MLKTFLARLFLADLRNLFSTKKCGIPPCPVFHCEKSRKMLRLFSVVRPHPYRAGGAFPPYCPRSSLLYVRRLVWVCIQSPCLPILFLSYHLQRRPYMNRSNPNYAIECTIDECANHCDCEPCCALSRISICSCSDTKALDAGHTECASFKPKPKY